MEGSIQFGLWYVFISWNTDNFVSRVRFVKSAVPGPVPLQLSRYLAGREKTLYPLVSIHLQDEGVFGEIYRHVYDIPYGETRTYKEIADLARTGPRVVGMAMKRNMTPLLIPCHRVLSSHGLGGFTPDINIKKNLLQLEHEVLKKMKRLDQSQS